MSQTLSRSRDQDWLPIMIEPMLSVEENIYVLTLHWIGLFPFDLQEALHWRSAAMPRCLSGSWLVTGA